MKIKFSILVAFAAILVAGCAAFFSVFGLSQLFAGASLAVIIMASSLEISKVVAVSFLQRYWTKVSRGLKIYLTIGVIVLVCITSAGIYGFLSNAYQKTASKYEISEGELSAINNKKDLYQKNIDDNKAIVATKTKRLEQLSALRTNQETRLDGGKSNADRNRARNDISSSSKEIQNLNTEIDGLNAKITPLLDSVNVYANKAIESKAKSSGASEIGPLKYLAQLTGQPMDKVVNWFILLLIFVFDPLAVALVIAANKVLELEKNNSEEPKKDTTKEILEDIVEVLNEEPIPEPVEETPSDRITAMTETIDVVVEPEEPEVINQEIEEPPHEELVEEPVEEPFLEEEPESESIKREPIVPTGSVKLEEIKEIKAQKRGFSKEIPPPNNNTIQRIGTNKFQKNNDADRLFYKKKK